jgi:sulfate transport system permease protein
LFGTLIAWTLVLYDFPLEVHWKNTSLNLPFALPAAVWIDDRDGILSKAGWVGSLIAPFGIQIAF